jgi:hypothetical protein
VLEGPRVCSQNLGGRGKRVRKGVGLGGSKVTHCCLTTLRLHSEAARSSSKELLFTRTASMAGRHFSRMADMSAWRLTGVGATCMAQHVGQGRPHT